METTPNTDAEPAQTTAPKIKDQSGLGLRQCPTEQSESLTQVPSPLRKKEGPPLTLPYSLVAKVQRRVAVLI